MLELPEQLKVVCICGGGGKTSLMYALAREARDAGLRTAIMTTTHIGEPYSEDFAVLTEPGSFGGPAAVWAAGKIPLPGTRGGKRRLASPPEPLTEEILEWAERVYVEADGSKNLPLKYPERWEPAILKGTGQVILVAGLSALGKPLEEVCHRAELAMERAQVSGGILTEEKMARILAVGYERYRPIVFLNQADDQALFARGMLVQQYLQEAGLGQVQIGSLKAAGLAVDKC